MIEDVKVLNDRILVKQKEAKTQSDGGIHLAPESVDRANDGKALVVAVGPGKKLENGKINEMNIKVGDQISYNPHSGAEIDIDGETYRILNEGDVYVIIGNLLSDK